MNPAQAIEQSLLTWQARWARAVESLYVDRVLACYHPQHPCLWGTVAGHRRDSADDIRTYFNHFLAKDWIVVHFDRPYVRVSDGLAINSGYYTFVWEADAKETTLNARYSMVYEKVGDAWLIVEHHSSAMPDEGV